MKRKIIFFQIRLDFLIEHVNSFPVMYGSWLSVMDKVKKNPVEIEQDAK